ncbi:MAG TPA: sugar ABC transporter permease [Microbacteriaceae bacterium]|jgi:multiple sugar transport system permease protein|nr:sugar ABC transporter permease [Microbacteriaceae bacterium]
MVDRLSTSMRWAAERAGLSSSPARKGSLNRGESLAGYMFVGPSFIGFILFVLGPLLAVAVLSMMRYDVISAPTFVGFANYQRLFTDTRLSTIYGNTLIYVVAAVLLINGLALVLATLISQQLPKWMTYLFRSVFFFPSLIALVYVSLIFQALFQKDTGIINYYIQSLGGHPIAWLSDPQQARISVIIVDVWRNVGFAMLIFVAALHEVPRELTEAAQIDGAGPWMTFRKITIPMISQAIFFNVTMTVIGAFQIYESIIVLTRGGPGDSTRSVVMYIAEKAFSDFQMGYASAISMTLFVIILVITLIQFRIRKAWVHYE